MIRLSEGTPRDRRARRLALTRLVAKDARPQARVRPTCRPYDRFHGCAAPARSWWRPDQLPGGLAQTGGIAVVLASPRRLSIDGATGWRGVRHAAESDESRRGSPAIDPFPMPPLVIDLARATDPPVHRSSLWIVALGVRDTPRHNFSDTSVLFALASKWAGKSRVRA